jgi:glycosyltransferase involved in cell wall biosynthesis
VPHHGPATQRLPDGKALGAAFDGADVVVLHSGFVPHNVAGARAARRRGVRYIVAPRGAYDPHIFRRRRVLKRIWWRLFEHPMVERAAALHLFFPEEKPDVERLGYRGPTVVAPNGVEPPAGVTWDGGSGGYVLWLGRFDPEQKGIDLLVEAMAAMPPAKRPRLRLIGPDWRDGRDRVAALVRRRNLRSWVSIEPAIYGDEKWEVLKGAAAFVYPSRWEGFGNSVAEAAAIGVPLLVTPYPLGRLLAARGAAVLAPATVEGLAEGLEKVQHESMIGRRAREIVRDEMSWDRVGRLWLAQAEALHG